MYIDSFDNITSTQISVGKIIAIVKQPAIKAHSSIRVELFFNVQIDYDFITVKRNLAYQSHIF